MHQEKYWASKVPLPLALLFLVNVFLIVGVELLFFYKYPAQPDAAALTKYDSQYSDCTILSTDSIGYLHAALVEAADGETHLVVTKAHNLAFGRGKIVYQEPVEISPDNEQIIPVKTGIHTSEIHISGSTVTIRYGNTGTIRDAAIYYMALAAVLEALELIVLHFIKKNLQ